MRSLRDGNWYKASTFCTSSRIGTSENLQSLLCQFACIRVHPRPISFCTLAPEFLQNLSCRVGPRAARQPCARMSSRTAQIQVLNGRSVACPVQYRTHGEELVQGKFAVEDVSAGEAVGGLEIE